MLVSRALRVLQTLLRCSFRVLATLDGTVDYVKTYKCSWITRSSSRLCTAGVI